MKMNTRVIRLSLACVLILALSACSTDNDPPTLAGSNPSSTGPAPVAVTGQTVCYNSTGILIDCAATGQDGDLQRGVRQIGPRFTDNGDGTVTDNLTGLMWIKEAECIENIHPEYNVWGEPISWNEGFFIVDQLNNGTYNCGATTVYDDWRVPNLREMQSLINLNFAGPAISDTAGTSRLTAGNPFTGVNQNYQYLTSTSLADGPDFFWYVSLYNGIVDMQTANKVAPNYHLWPVRTSSINAPAPPPDTGMTECYDHNGFLIACAGTGQDAELSAGVDIPTPRFTDNNNGTVTDRLTGLMWLKDANCIGNQLPNLDVGSVKEGKVSWQHGLDFIAGLNYGAHDCGQPVQYTDWRLPNYRELHSLINFNFFNPAVSDTIGDSAWTVGDPFVGLESAAYWSSSNVMFLYTDGKAAWTVNMNTGNTDLIESDKFLMGNYVWPVRGGK